MGTHSCLKKETPQPVRVRDVASYNNKVFHYICRLKKKNKVKYLNHLQERTQNSDHRPGRICRKRQAPLPPLGSGFSQVPWKGRSRPGARSAGSPAAPWAAIPSRS